MRFQFVPQEELRCGGQMRYMVCTQTRTLGYVQQIGMDSWWGMKASIPDIADRMASNDAEQISLFPVGKKENRYSRLVHSNARINAARMLKDDWKHRAQGSGFEYFVDIETYLAHVNASINKFGWKSFKDGTGTTCRTAEVAFYSMFPSSEDIPNGRIRFMGFANALLLDTTKEENKSLVLCDQDYDYARRALQWGLHFEENDQKGWFRIIALVARSEKIQFTEVDYAASLLWMFRNHLRTQNESGLIEEMSNFVGQKHETYKRSLKLYHRNVYGSFPNQGVIHKYHDYDGNVYVAFFDLTKRGLSTVEILAALDRISLRDTNTAIPEKVEYPDTGVEPAGWQRLKQDYHEINFTISKHNRRLGVNQNIINIHNYGPIAKLEFKKAMDLFVDPLDEFLYEDT